MFENPSSDGSGAGFQPAIGNAIAYEQGGYETSPSASNVAPGVENVLMAAIKEAATDLALSQEKP